MLPIERLFKFQIGLVEKLIADWTIIEPKIKNIFDSEIVFHINNFKSKFLDEIQKQSKYTRFNFITSLFYGSSPSNLIQESNKNRTVPFLADENHNRPHDSHILSFGTRDKKQLLLDLDDLIQKYNNTNSIKDFFALKKISMSKMRLCIMEDSCRTAI